MIFMANQSKRAAERRDFKVQVQVQHESQLQKFYSKNISSGGIFLQTEDLIPIGNELQLSFSIPGRKQPLKVSAKVVRHHKMQGMDDNFNPTNINGIGLSFVNLSSEDQNTIDQYITGKGLAVQG